MLKSINRLVRKAKRWVRTRNYNWQPLATLRAEVMAARQGKHKSKWDGVFEFTWRYSKLELESREDYEHRISHTMIGRNE